MLEDHIWSGAVARVVLVVDDDPEVLDVLAAMLEDLGCEVVTATGPQEALEKLGADPRAEVLFTDIEMPVPKPFGTEAIARAMDDAAGLC